MKLLPPPVKSSTSDISPEEQILPISLVIYFDEAHSLTSPSNRLPKHKSHFDMMLSCLEDMRSRDLHIFTIFLSTNFHLWQLAPAPAFATSARMTVTDAFIQAPITELPFDCFRKLPVAQDFRSLSSVELLTSFGRPLYVVHLITLFMDID